VNAQGEGLRSAEASATPVTVPTAPQTLTATAGNTQVVLTWTAPASDGGSAITGYRVYQGMTSGSEVLLATLAVVFTYTSTGLTNGQIYYFQVSAANAVGEGPRAAEVSSTPATAPSEPQTLTATAGASQVLLTWAAPASDGGSVITGYNVYQGTTSIGKTLLTTTAALTYTSTGLTNGQI
jgi:predicted phage tail protein